MEKTQHHNTSTEITATFNSWKTLRNQIGVLQSVLDHKSSSDLTHHTTINTIENFETRFSHLLEHRFCTDNANHLRTSTTGTALLYSFTPPPRSDIPPVLFRPAINPIMTSFGNDDNIFVEPDPNFSSKVLHQFICDDKVNFQNLEVQQTNKMVSRQVSNGNGVELNNIDANGLKHGPPTTTNTTAATALSTLSASLPQTASTSKVNNGDSSSRVSRRKSKLNLRLDFSNDNLAMSRKKAFCATAFDKTFGQNLKYNSPEFAGAPCHEKSPFSIDAGDGDIEAIVVQHGISCANELPLVVVHTSPRFADEPDSFAATEPTIPILKKSKNEKNGKSKPVKKVTFNQSETVYKCEVEMNNSADFETPTCGMESTADVCAIASVTDVDMDNNIWALTTSQNEQEGSQYQERYDAEIVENASQHSNAGHTGRSTPIASRTRRKILEEDTPKIGSFEALGISGNDFCRRLQLESNEENKEDSNAALVRKPKRKRVDDLKDLKKNESVRVKAKLGG